MELRVLEYFMAISREGNILKAAKSIHITQPTLSRQIKNLENELGIKLIDRSGKLTKLTNDGILFAKRAEEILSLINKTKNEIANNTNDIVGDIYIGAAEVHSNKFIFDKIYKFRKKYENVRFHITSGDQDDVYRDLNNGLIDFGIVFGNVDKTKYESKNIKTAVKWGLLFDKKDKLSKNKLIKTKELLKLPLIVSRQLLKNAYNDNKFDKANVVATYNLLYNAMLMAESGIGYVLCLSDIVNTTGKSNLCFVPVEHQPKFNLNIIWKKQTIYSKTMIKFISNL